MDYRTDEHGQVSMDLAEAPRQLPKMELRTEKEPEPIKADPDERPVVCPQGPGLKEVVELVKGHEFCRERCGEHFFSNTYEAMRIIYDCVWIKRKVTGYGSAATTRDGQVSLK